MQVLLLCLAGFFSIEAVILLYTRKHKNPIMRFKGRIYFLLMVGVLSLTIAYSMKHVYSYVFGETIPLVSDLFFVISYVTLIVAFVLFWVDTGNIKKFEKKEPYFMFGVIAMVVIWILYFFVKIMRPGLDGMPAMNIYLYYFYPLAASFLFFSTLIIYPSYRAGHIKSPLYYMSAGIFMNFIAEMFYLYNKWNLPSRYMEYAYSIFFVISSFYFLLGFYAAYKKWKR